MKKSKPAAGRTKRPQQMSKEELIATLLKKKQCNAKALSIVQEMLQSDVNSQWLLNSLQFISQSHYQDAVEERAIIKICGYPLCKNPLVNIPKQQFRISTQNNKVYDISERKNFCSNACYRSSSFLKDQVLTSPLWLRDIEKVPEFKLLDGVSIRGGVGDEIDVGPTRVTTEEVSSKDHSTSNEVGECSEREDSVENTPSKHEEKDGLAVNPQSYAVLSRNEHDVQKKKIMPESNVNLEEKLSAFCLDESFKTALPNLKETSQTVVLEGTSKQQECRLPMKPCSASSISEGPESVDIVECTSQGVETADDSKQNALSKDSIHEQTLSALSMNENNYPTSIENRAHRISGESREKCNLKGSTENNKQEEETDNTQTKARKQKRMNKHTKAPLVAVPHVYELVEERLTEWFTVDSLCFLYGEQETREMLGKLGGDLKQNFKPLDSATWDPEKYDRFVNVCKRLNLLDLEDRSYDEKVINEDKNVVKKPLPDFNKLKEEATRMDLQVQAFYKGQLEVEPRKVTFAEDVQEEAQDSELPVIPLVHQHEQRALRRRLVLDSLNRVLPDLLRTLGVHSSQVNSALRGLVGTFALSARNITFNPRQWTLVAIVIIKLLSVREARLQRALASEASQKYLTLIQMSYNLSPTFLDLFLDRLVSSAIAPPKSADSC